MISLVAVVTPHHYNLDDAFPSSAGAGTNGKRVGPAQSPYSLRLL